MIDDHPGDALSGLLDGELDAATAQRVRQHVTACAACAAELDDIRAARASLRLLPAVEPPPGFLESLQPGSNVVPLRRRRAATIGANVAAAAAAAIAAVVLLGGDPGPATAVAAEPHGAAERHDSTVSAITAGAGAAAAPGLVLPDRRVPATTAPAQVLEDLPPRFVAPDRLVGYRLVAAYRAPLGVHLLYEKGEHRLSVFEQEGDLRDLPADLRRVGDVWLWDDERAEGRVVISQHDGVVITVVGDESPEVVLEAARSLPAPGGAAAGSFGRRLRTAAGDVLETLSPAG